MFDIPGRQKRPGAKPESHLINVTIRLAFLSNWETKPLDIPPGLRKWHQNHAQAMMNEHELVDIDSVHACHTVDCLNLVPILMLLTWHST
jgi:hypothetical protein